MLDMDCLASLLHLVKPTALALLNTTATATTSRLSATQHYETCSLVWTSHMAPQWRAKSHARQQQKRGPIDMLAKLRWMHDIERRALPKDSLSRAIKPSTAQSAGCGAGNLGRLAARLEARLPSGGQITDISSTLDSWIQQLRGDVVYSSTPSGRDSTRK